MSGSELKKCPKCGGEMDKGRLRSYAGIDVGVCKLGWTVRTQKIDAFACHKCGYLELYKEMKKKKGQVMVYRERLADPWHCSWCSFKHKDYEKVIEHENNEHGGKKE